MLDTTEDRLMSTKETMKFVGVAKQTLRGFDDLPYYKIGGLIKYKLSDLEKWLESHSVGTES